MRLYFISIAATFLAIPHTCLGGDGEAAQARSRCFRDVVEKAYARAIVACELAKTLSPSDPESYSNQGSAYLMLGDYDRAIVDFTEAIRRVPRDARHHYNRGLAYDAKGSLDLSIADYDAAIRLRPEFAAAFFNRAQALKASGQTQRAIIDYRRALALAPKLRAVINRAIEAAGRRTVRRSARG